MKTILIPTLFASDTDNALRIAADIDNGSAQEIILLSLCEVSDSISELLFLSSNDRDSDLHRRDEVLQSWKNYKDEHELKTELKMHHQYGLSRPIVKTLMTRFDVEMIIVPQSFKLSKQYIHQFALRLFNQSGCPIMFLPDGTIKYKTIQRALYLDESKSVQSSVVQQYSFHVIHKSMIKEASVRTIVDQMQIDLIVKGKRNGVDNSDYDIDASDIGLPILTI